MSFTGKRLSGGAVRLIALTAAIAVCLAAWSLTAGDALAYEAPPRTVAGELPPAQTGDGPEANLPYLFAVYIVTWAAFFGYVFYVSRRQREMQREIDALKYALEERDRQEAE